MTLYPVGTEAYDSQYLHDHWSYTTVFGGEISLPQSGKQCTTGSYRSLSYCSLILPPAPHGRKDKGDPGGVSQPIPFIKAWRLVV